MIKPATYEESCAHNRIADKATRKGLFDKKIQREDFLNQDSFEKIVQRSADLLEVTVDELKAIHQEMLAMPLVPDVAFFNFESFCFGIGIRAGRMAYLAGNEFDLDFNSPVLKRCMRLWLAAQFIPKTNPGHFDFLSESEDAEKFLRLAQAQLLSEGEKELLEKTLDRGVDALDVEPRLARLAYSHEALEDTLTRKLNKRL